LNDYVGGQSFCCGEKEFEPSQTGKDEFETSDYEHLIFFYHPDHLGSTALVTDNDGNVVQSVAYIPYGEVFIEERNGTWNTPYLFNGKELDEETGLYYYGARYLNPTSGMWLSVDPLFEKYVGMSPYQYCNLNPLRFVDPTGMAGHEVNIETGDITWIDDLTEDNVAEGFMYVPAGEMLNEVVVYPKSMKGNTQNDDASAKNALASFGGTMATVVGNITNGIDGTANPMKDQGGSVGLTSKSRSFNYYKPQERYKGNGFYGNQYVKTYQLKHLGSVANKVGVVGTIVSSATSIGIGFVEDGNQIGENTQRAAVKSFGSWAGAMAGAKCFATFGSFICPGWGTLVGGFVGGVVGGLAGEYIFEELYEYCK
jgi:RHS repeat-associated protein